MVIAVGGSSFAIDTRALALGDLYDGTVLTQNATTITVDEGGGFTAHFTGTSFAYNAFGDIAAGTLTGISEDYLGATTFTLTGIDVPATLFYQWVLDDDNQTALVTVFNGNDSITGTAFDDYIEAFSGHDVIAGGAGGDSLIGGDGNDHLYGAGPNGGADAADSLSGGNGADYLQGNAGNDTLDGGAQSDRINGGADNDLIAGGGGNDTVNGNLGNDTVGGGDGNDSLRGGQGNDSIEGGVGDDYLSGDKGLDTLAGGAGADAFHLGNGEAGIVSGATDLIVDFTHGVDHLQLGFLPSHLRVGSPKATEALAQSDAQAVLNQHPGEAGDVVAYQVGADTYLFWNGVGGGVVDSAVQLHGVTASSLGLTDFV